MWYNLGMVKVKSSLNSADIEMLKGIFATKDDLKRFATKDDLKRFATKDDLLDMRDELTSTITQFKSDFFEMIDPILKEIVANRDERTIMAHNITELRERVEKIEKQLGMSA